MGSNGFEWKEVGLTGFEWKEMGLNGFEWNAMGLNGFEWKEVGLNGFEWKVGLNGFEWKVGLNGFEWKEVGLNGFEWKEMGLNGFEWKEVGLNGFEWKVGLNGFEWKVGSFKWFRFMKTVERMLEHQRNSHKISKQIISIDISCTITIWIGDYVSYTFVILCSSWTFYVTMGNSSSVSKSRMRCDCITLTSRYLLEDFPSGYPIGLSHRVIPSGDPIGLSHRVISTAEAIENILQL